MKSIINRRKLYVILAISLFLLSNTLAITNGFANTIQEDAVFNLDKEDPLGPEGYGAIIPSPNTLGAVTIDGSNQGKFTVMDWDGSLTGFEEIISNPGEDISLYYPMPLDDYVTGLGSFTNNDEIDPWSEIGWLNASAYNAEAENLLPFTVNTVFDYYVIGEGGTLNAPANHEHPMQIDVIVKSRGPKTLQFDWLMQNPAAASFNYYLISPSGKFLNPNIYDIPISHTLAPGTVLFNTVKFAAIEIGAYRLIFEIFHIAPSSLYLEFLTPQMSSLPVNTVKFGANSEGLLSIEAGSYADWQTNCFTINGKKGDIFELDLFEDYATGFTPIIDIWTPSDNGYLLALSVGTGTHEIYFPKSGAAYVSFSDMIFGDWYRYSLFLKKIDTVQYNLGDPLTSFMISDDESTAIQFSLQKDAIVRFNYTSLPPGNPEIYAFTTPRAIIFRDSQELLGYDINNPIFTRTVDSTDLYWHYLPRGTYKAVIRNTNPTADGIFQISSKVFDWSDDSIPVNTLTYPTQYPSNFANVEFGPDSEFMSLKDPIGIDINIPDIGQFRLNTTMWATDNVGANATSDPSYLYTYNSTGPADYYSFGYPQPVFSLDGDSTATDYLYIGNPTRWTGMTFDFSVLGVGGTMELEVYDGGWPILSEDSDGTSELTADGTIEFDMSDPDFDDWIKGAGGIDIDPAVDESDYYWMRLDCTGDYSGGTVPVIQELTLLNNTLRGDLEFILIGESRYEHDDYWGPGGLVNPADPANLEVSLDDDVGGSYNYDSRESFIISASDPLTIGFEGGTYKLLIIPELWDYPGAISIQFAVEDFWAYRHQESYDISTLSPTPNLHAVDINNFTTNGYANGTGTVYNYGLSTQYNHTETTLAVGGDESYFALECIGDPYQWTQLVVSMDNVSDYELYLIQDLPWIDASGPNTEVMTIASTVSINRTFEFGVFSDHFTLLFEVADAAEIISFSISLSQYDTVALVTRDLRASYTPPLDPALVLTLAIVIPAAAGAAVVVYILKKKGKILTKHPRPE
jgi:hypothetical protein